MGNSRTGLLFEEVSRPCIYYFIDGVIVIFIYEAFLKSEIHILIVFVTSLAAVVSTVMLTGSTLLGAGSRKNPTLYQSLVAMAT